MNIEEEIQQIHKRNKIVEANKSWEISLTRKILVAITTYLLALGFLLIIKAENPYLGAFVPVIGFWLSMWNGGFMRKYWEKHKK